jgi:hypothetical protein
LKLFIFETNKPNDVKFWFKEAEKRRTSTPLGFVFNIKYKDYLMESGKTLFVMRYDIYFLNILPTAFFKWALEKALNKIWVDDIIFIKPRQAVIKITGLKE